MSGEASLPACLPTSSSVHVEQEVGSVLRGGGAEGGGCGKGGPEAASHCPMLDLVGFTRIGSLGAKIGSLIVWGGRSGEGEAHMRPLGASRA